MSFFMSNNLALFVNEKTHEHSRNVSKIAGIMAERIGYGKTETAFITEASALHDLGKQFISTQILMKPGKLDDEEFTIIKTHAVIGYKYLKMSAEERLNDAADAKDHDQAAILAPVLDITAPQDRMFADDKTRKSFIERMEITLGVYGNAKSERVKLAATLFAGACMALQHHERPDGKGYLGMVSSEICAYAKLVAAADVFDALMSKRAYKKAWPPEDVYEFMRTNAGTQFDKIHVAALLDNDGRIFDLYKSA
jgi:HD-GYP domain-containing protein (c-di-GMP phosphodiesterase class II)